MMLLELINMYLLNVRLCKVETDTFMCENIHIIVGKNCA